jgi:hypothetical protein
MKFGNPQHLSSTKDMSMNLHGMEVVIGWKWPESALYSLVKGAKVIEV